MPGEIRHAGMSTEEALLSDNPVTAAMARLVASPAITAIQAWAEDEINARDTAPAHMLHALAMILAQTQGSIAASLLTPAGLAPFLKLSMQTHSEWLYKIFIMHQQHDAARQPASDGALQ